MFSDGFSSHGHLVLLLEPVPRAGDALRDLREFIVYRHISVRLLEVDAGFGGLSVLYRIADVDPPRALLEHYLEFHDVLFQFICLEAGVREVQFAQVLLPFLSHSQIDDHGAVDEDGVLGIDQQHTLLLVVGYLNVMLQFEIVHGIYHIGGIGGIHLPVGEFELAQQQFHLCPFASGDQLAYFAVGVAADILHYRQELQCLGVLYYLCVILDEIFVQFRRYESAVRVYKLPYLGDLGDIEIQGSVDEFYVVPYVVKVADAEGVDERYLPPVEFGTHRIGDLSADVHHDRVIGRILLGYQFHRVLCDLVVVGQFPELGDAVCRVRFIAEQFDVIVLPGFRVEVLIQAVVQLSADDRDVLVEEIGVGLAVESIHGLLQSRETDEFLVDLPRFVCAEVSLNVLGVSADGLDVLDLSVDEPHGVSGVFRDPLHDLYVGHHRLSEDIHAEVSRQLSRSNGEDTYAGPVQPVVQCKCQRCIVA